LNSFIYLQMAALDRYRDLVARVRAYLHHHQELLPGMVLAQVAAYGGVEGYAVALGVQDNFDQFAYLLVFYLECHRLCDMGRGWEPYQPMLPPQ
jgi:hypothetical protein